MEKMIIGITGANGFIGSSLRKHFQKKRIPFHIFRGDLLNKNDAQTFFKQHNITHVIHLVGTFKPPFSNFIKKNVLTTQSLLESGCNLGLKKIIYTSSGAVYGEPIKKKSIEKDTPSPNTLYGLSKFFAEQTIQYFQQTSGLSYIILRFPNVYGEGSKQGVIYNFLKDIKKKKIITINGDGKQRRDFLHVTDACVAIEKALSYTKSDIFNISPAKSYSLLDITKLLAKKYTFSIQHDQENNPLKNLLLNSGKAQRLLKFSATHDISVDL